MIAVSALVTTRSRFRLYFVLPLTYTGTVSKVLPPIVVNGVRYRVLRLEGGGGPRFLLRSDDSGLFGVYARNAQTALSAAPLELKLTVDHPFRGVDFFETDDDRRRRLPLSANEGETVGWP